MIAKVRVLITDYCSTARLFDHSSPRLPQLFKYTMHNNGNDSNRPNCSNRKQHFYLFRGEIRLLADFEGDDRVLIVMRLWLVLRV